MQELCQLVFNAVQLTFLFRLRLTQKAFQLSFQFFVLFFSFRHLFLTDCPKLLSQCFNFSYQQNVLMKKSRKKSDSFLGHMKIYFHKNCFSCCYSRSVWHKIRFMHRNQHLQHPKKDNKLPESIAKNSETSYIDSQQMAKDSSVSTERNRVDKQQSMKKKKREDVQNKKLIAAPCEAL